MWEKTYDSKSDFESEIPASESGTADVHQYNIARQAALHLINSGAFGDSTKDFSVALSASGDRVTVAIAQK
jgi:hypothetical protein